MKSFELQTRSTIYSFFLLTVIIVFIYALICKFLFYSQISLDSKITYFLCATILAILPIVSSYLSMIDNSVYLSDFIITEDTIRFVYSKKKEQVNVDVIEKKDIKEVNLCVKSNISVPSTFFVEFDIILNDNKKIEILDKKEFSTYVYTTTKQKFINAILKNKDDIPNLNFNIDGTSMGIINSYKYLYDTGKNFPYYKLLYYTARSFPFVLQIWFAFSFIVGILVVVAFIFFKIILGL